MKYRYTSRDAPPGGGPARVVALVLLGIIVVVLLLDLSDSPWLANRLAGLGRQRPLVGLIAGHWQSDSGAVCPDGLKEVDLNLAIARRVADRLRAAGYRAEVLPEFSPKLDGYRSDAFLSIHNDSCVALTGFKVARLTHSSDPEREDRLVQALYRTYAASTGLQPHLNTVTDDMREYHAFRRIAPATPGAIIECGFIGGDRHLLTQEQDRVAAGIAEGLIAFLQ
ncbi:MAG: N-acetylmuramoyl-L-alanine amidase [Chloroflexota bacterium]